MNADSARQTIEMKETRNRHTMIPRERFPVEIGRRSTGETGLTFLTRSLVIYDPHDTVDKSTKSGADYKIEIP